MSDLNMVDMKILPGIIGAEGVAVGPAHVLDRAHIKVPRRNILPDQVQREFQRFTDARQKSLDQLQEAIVRVSRRDHRLIIETHMMLTADEMLFEDVSDLIERELICTEWAVDKVIAEVIKPLNEQDEEYLKERVTDLEHVSNRLQRNLIGLTLERLDAIREPVVVVTHDLSPADMAQVKSEFVLGIITDVGGSTGHTAILARGMNIPTLVGVKGATTEIRSGATVVLDAFEGRAIVNPPEELVGDFLAKKKLFEAQKVELLKYKDLPSVTKDHHPVMISANIELPEEISTMLDHGIPSIGLFRSEFLYLTSASIPTEQEQFELYRDTLQKVGPGNSVTIRTLDLGADKILPDYTKDREANPALGVRAIRLSLMRVDVFKDQLSALLRASAFGKLRIMFPMICGVGEVRRAKEILEEVRADLRKKGIAFDENIEIGIMIEVPSAAMIADVLAREVDFFSIGTNDLIQYTLAVDRINEHISYLYTPLHPAVLRLINDVVRKGHEAGIRVSMCGEMAGQIHFTMLLVGFGLDELSMPVSAALKIKWFLRNITLTESKEFAKNILSLKCSADVENYLHEQMSGRFPELFPADYWKHHR